MGLFDTLFNAFRKLKTSLMLPSSDIEISADYVFRNAYFVAGVEAIIRGLQRLEVEVVNDKGEKTKTFLDNINLNDLLRAIIYDLYTYGNAYVYIIKVANKITNLFSLPPSKVLIKTNNDGTALYVLEGKEINGEDILHFKRFIPNEADYYRTIRGDSVTKGIEDMLKLNYLINSSLAINFKRNNLPSIALINKQPIPASERERFIEDMEQKLMGNYSFLYLQGDTELKELVAKFPEWTLTVKDKIRDEVLAVLGVPRLLVGDTDSVNYANAKQQYQVFYTETIIPLARLLEDEFNSKIFGKQGLRLRFRTDAIEVLQQDIKERAQAMMILWQMGYSVEELAEMFNLPKPKISENNKTKEDTNEEKTDTNIVIRKTIDNMMLEDVRIKAFNFRKKSDREFFNLITKLVAENIREFDSEMFNKVLSVLRGDMKLADFEYELDKFFLDRNNDWITTTKDFYIKNTFTFLKEVHRKQVQKDMFSLLVDNIIDRHAKKIKKTNETVKRQIRNKISNLLNSYGSVRELSDEIVENIKLYIIKPFKNQRARAMTIARTELTSVVEDVNFTYHEAYDFQYKIWVTAMDEVVRESHQHLDGMKVWIGEVFPNGLMYPGDPHAVDPGEVINCRCTVIYEP